MKLTLLLLTLLGLLLTSVAANAEILWTSTVTHHDQPYWRVDEVEEYRYVTISCNGIGPDEIGGFYLSSFVRTGNNYRYTSDTYPNPERFQYFSDLVTYPLPLYVRLSDSRYGSFAESYFPCGFAGYKITALGFDISYFKYTVYDERGEEMALEVLQGYDYEVTGYIEGTPVPEPSSIFALLSSLGGLGIVLRRRR